MICAAVIQVAEATSAAMRPVIDYPFPIPLTRKGARTDHNSRPPRAKEESPLGEMVAHASSEGYAATSERNPYCYYFKILTRQGPMAAGGEVDYVVRGKMIGGFAPGRVRQLRGDDLCCQLLRFPEGSRGAYRKNCRAHDRV